jgi:hypothetical protein
MLAADLDDLGSQGFCGGQIFSGGQGLTGGHSGLGVTGLSDLQADKINARHKKMIFIISPKRRDDKRF